MALTWALSPGLSPSTTQTLGAVSRVMEVLSECVVSDCIPGSGPEKITVPGRPGTLPVAQALALLVAALLPAGR